MVRKYANHKKFDFDVGHITQSPCRTCDLKAQLPGCAENCQKLNQLQTRLVGSVSCSNGFHDLEAYTIAIGND